MGYRSEVTILTSGEPAKLEAFKQAMLLRYKNHDCFDLVERCLGEDDRNNYCEYWAERDGRRAHYRADYHAIKWYTEAQEWLKDYQNTADESGIGVEFMRVGEETDDIEHEQNDASEEDGDMLYTVTEIRVSGRD